MTKFVTTLSFLHPMTNCIDVFTYKLEIVYQQCYMNQQNPHVSISNIQSYAAFCVGIGAQRTLARSACTCGAILKSAFGTKTLSE